MIYIDNKLFVDGFLRQLFTNGVMSLGVGGSVGVREESGYDDIFECMRPSKQRISWNPFNA